MRQITGRRSGFAVLMTLAIIVVAVGAQSPATEISAPASATFFGLTPQFALSPDGQQLIFVAAPQGRSQMLWARSIATGAVRALSGTEQASYPFWSPDSQSVGFFASGKLKTVRIDGGAPAIVCDSPTGRGGTWNSDNVIVFASGIGDPLRKVTASGGASAIITKVDVPRENSHRWPQFLPDGKHILFWGGAGTGPAQLRVASLDSGDIVTLGPADTNGAFAAGFLFFKTGNALRAQRFDPVALTRSGEPIAITEPISTDAGSAFASFSVSTTGSVAYTRGMPRPLVLTWFDRDGRAAGTVGTPGQYTNVRMSPDGKRLAVSLTAGTPANRDVWTVEVGSGAAARITTDAAVDATPVWSPNGTEIAFSSQRAGPYQIYRRPLSASADHLLLAAPTASIATDWSRDGRFIPFTRTGATTGLDVWILPVGEPQKAFPFVDTPAAEDNATISPNGQWMAYQSNTSGRDEVYVEAIPAGMRQRTTMSADGRLQISIDGGTQPLWRADGRELFFLAPDGSVMSSAVTTSLSFGAAEPHAILPAAMTLVIRHAYTVTPDGQRVLMPVLDQTNPSTIAIRPAIN